MKSTSIILSFFLYLATISSTAAQTEHSALIGVWSLNYLTSVNSMPSELQEHFNTMPSARRLQIENAYKGRQLIFNADGSFIQILSDGRKTSGTWRLTSNDQDIEFTNSKGISQIKSIRLLSTTLILGTKGSKASNAFLPQLHFVKN